MRYILSLLLLICIGTARAQVSYFPPLTGTSWDTMSIASQGWCSDDVDSLYNYLQQKNTDAFIILVDGKIVIEKYFGTYTRDSVHYWASAGKSLTSMLVGIAQEKGLLSINNPASQYLGTGWTSASPGKENLITVKHLLTMCSGLDDAYTTGGCTNEDTAKACLQYLTDAGTRWAYHTGAYRKLQAVVSNANSSTYLAATNNWVGNHIGMSGFWYNGVYYSTARGMARYGLLMLNKAIWNNDTLLHDTAYYNAMVNTSQTYNPAYGYLWWLNGKASYMVPTSQLVGTGTLIPNAPADMFCALGKNDQKIYVVPSKKMVVVRQGASSGTPLLALSSFDNEVWRYIDSLPCFPAAIGTLHSTNTIRIYPNPATNTIAIQAPVPITDITLYNITGCKLMQQHIVKPSTDINLSIQDLPAGMYLLQCNNSSMQRFYKE